MKGESAIHAFMKSMERIEDLVLAGFSLPLTPWTVVNGDQLLPLLDHVRETLPEEVVQARLILERRDEIIADAQRKGVYTLEESKQQAEAMLNNSALMRAVEDEANKIRHQMMTEIEAYQKRARDEADAIRHAAMEDARRIREGADGYAEQVLSSLDKDLTSFHQVVKTGQQHLRQVQTEAARNARLQPQVTQSQVNMVDPRLAKMPPNLAQTQPQPEPELPRHGVRAQKASQRKGNQGKVGQKMAKRSRMPRPSVVTGVMPGGPTQSPIR